ncbi:hypothetical protein [Sphingobacterium pedocola]|uniref:Uncharacterized protein n=1 Tax=Sphingobacterium pedocola TaxID=2082722 RepID=A0ABR9TA56_9SPHI|nr:hypothetical protein [Sphingobacterium pedocola]MBE8722252.1 hypothetical protein [Sphingobacterium pedocola]
MQPITLSCTVLNEIKNFKQIFLISYKSTTLKEKINELDREKKLPDSMQTQKQERVGTRKAI